MALGHIFSWSALGKIKGFSQFASAIRGFRILPDSWASITASIFLAAEIASVLLFAVGGPALLAAFIFTGALLIVYCAALLSVLVRGLRAACNCFGLSKETAGKRDILRNLLLILCAAGGILLVLFAPGSRSPMGVWETILAGLWAVAFTLAVINLGAFPLRSGSRNHINDRNPRG
jgi:hypothetical protein